MFFNSSLGKIYYSKVGHGPHLCFLHGFCESSELWAEQITHLKDSYCCISIDLPGFGKSENVSYKSIEDLAQVVVELLDHLEVGKTHLLGHSMGGYIAAAIAATNANRLLSLSFIHSTSKADKPEKLDSRNKVIEFVAENGALPFLKQFYPKLVAESKLENLKEKLWDLVASTPKDAIINATKAMRDRKDRSELLATLDIPVFFLCGDKDEFFPLTDIYLQASTAKLAQVSVLKEIGHLSMFESPEQASLRIQEFLEFVELLNE